MNISEIPIEIEKKVQISLKLSKVHHKLIKEAIKLAPRQSLNSFICESAIKSSKEKIKHDK